MGKYTAESSGIDVLRSTAAQVLAQNQEKKKRIWSQEIEAWGFFSLEEITKEDTFLLICSVTPGDRLAYKFDASMQPQIATVVGIWRQLEEKDIPVWVCQLIDPKEGLIHISVEEKELFYQAWKMFR